MQSSLMTGLKGRAKFILGGLFILAAITYLILSSTKANAEYYMTVDELHAKSASMVGKNLRITGAVVGSTIQFDPKTNNLAFDIANVPGDNATIEAQGGLAQVLHDAAADPTRRRLNVIYTGPKPDLMRDEAQAIITGHLGADGVFRADELLLKCPTKYEQAVPTKAAAK